jgi:hypothetical protein
LALDVCYGLIGGLNPAVGSQWKFRLPGIEHGRLGGLEKDI